MSLINIFLSYARRDSDVAVGLEQALQNLGVGVWRDQEKLYAGAQWPRELGDAVAAQDALLLLWTEPAARSKFVELEWCTALALGKPVLPYLVDETPLPPVLTSFHGVQADSPERDAPRLVERLRKQPQSQSHESSWLLTALEGIPSGDPERAFRTVRAMLTTAAANTTSETITALRDEESVRSPFLAGAEIGDRYEIKSLLGRGGMGEVWRAFDLKLRVEVALKVLHGATDQKSIEALRGEVRTAREVISPNVCRIFDLGEANGTEFLSMEYVDGKTLAELMAENGPYRVDEASPLASQLLASLQAIHEAALVHRDIKPENLMVTRTGRLVVMDLGLARFRSDDGVYSVSGTPAYMSPEQLSGHTVDARSDVYAAGVVLAELTAPAGARNLAERSAVWSGIQQDPPELPQTPWARVLTTAVSRDPEARYPSAQAMARALEKETVKTIGELDASPYPGLAAFTEDEAEFFFGREAEVETLWKKLAGQPRLLAVVGPSGAGKSSFLGAGVLAASPEGWTALRISPGGSPFVALGQALARAMPNDPLLAEQMVRFSESDVAVDLIRRWVESTSEALLIVDQFEELFTQNSQPVQEAFSKLLARLPIEAGVHVVLGMRDDFLIVCHQYEPLAPIYSELTPLEAPSGEDLRRAIVQPALKCGFRFEDDALVDEMIAAVRGERGALPLLAFACSKMWEGRDRQQGLLTRGVYQSIGGVAGALAGHAEATLERIGSNRLPFVRELLRNLVTSQGTRAEQEREELLSVFPEEARQAAAEVLGELIDARLLVSYEELREETERHRIEIIHESLLVTWPRLVRWQTRDADAAQMRDQLRQAARLWEQRGRSVDLLWSGTAYKEFDLWREQYPGRLTDTEQAFARAMSDHANRRRRRRRIAAGAVFVALLLVIGVISRFWQQSDEARKAAVVARQETEAALLKSEANRLVTLGRLNELERNPSAAIGYAIASLEMADTDEGRFLALEALWRGPPALVLEDVPDSDSRSAWRTSFSPNGRWLVNAESGGEVVLYEQDGSLESRHFWKAHESAVFHTAFNLDSSWLWTATVSSQPPTVESKFWSVPKGELLLEERGPFPVRWDLKEESAATVELRDGKPTYSRISLEAGPAKIEHGEIEMPPAGDPRAWLGKAMIAPDAEWLASVEGGALVVRRLGREPAEVRRFAVQTERISQLRIRDGFLAVALDTGAIHFFSLEDKSAEPLYTVQGPRNPTDLLLLTKGEALFSRNADSGESTWWWLGESGPLSRSLNLDTNVRGTVVDDQVELLATGGGDGTIQLWPLRGPVALEPTLLRRGRVNQINDLDFHPSEPWLATADSTGGLTLRPLKGPRAWVIWRHREAMTGLKFAPDGSWLAASGIGSIRIWPLEGKPTAASWELHSDGSYIDIDTDEAGRWIVAAEGGGNTKLISTTGKEVVELRGFSSQTWRVALSADGHLAAASGGQFDPAERKIRIWDVATGEELSVFDSPNGELIDSIHFCGDESNLHLYSTGYEIFWKWDIANGVAEVVSSDEMFGYGGLHCLADGRMVGIYAATDKFDLRLLDLDSGEETALRSDALDSFTGSLDPSGTIFASGDQAGVIRVSRIGDDQPHLLLGHTGGIVNIQIDPAGRWIASTSEDRTVRLWPMPDLSRPAFHTLPLDEFLDHLKALTNYRVVVDETEPSGFKVITVPFDSWETVPEWW